MLLPLLTSLLNVTLGLGLLFESLLKPAGPTGLQAADHSRTLVLQDRLHHMARKDSSLLWLAALDPDIGQLEHAHACEWAANPYAPCKAQVLLT